MLDPTVAVTLNYLDFARDQTLVIESTAGVDLELLLTLSSIMKEAMKLHWLLTKVSLKVIRSPCISQHHFLILCLQKNDLMSSLSTRIKKLLASQLSRKWNNCPCNQENLNFSGSSLVSYRDLYGDQVTGVLEDLAGNMATQGILRLPQVSITQSFRW